MKRLLNLLYPIIAVAIMLSVWAVAAAAMGQSLILPTPRQTARAFVRLIGTAAFWRGLGGTFSRALTAYAVCLIIALALAVLARLNPIKKVIAPIMTVARSVPTVAVIFLLILLAGSKHAPIYVAITVMLPTMYAAFVGALDGIDKGLGEMSRVYRVPRRVRLIKLYIPALAPALVSSATFLSLGIKLVVAAEALSMTAGSLGMLLMDANTAIETARLAAVALAAVLAGFAVEGLAAIFYLPLKRRGYAV